MFVQHLLLLYQHGSFGHFQDKYHYERHHLCMCPRKTQHLLAVGCLHVFHFCPHVCVCSIQVNSMLLKDIITESTTIKTARSRSAHNIWRTNKTLSCTYNVTIIGCCFCSVITSRSFST